MTKKLFTILIIFTCVLLANASDPAKKEGKEVLFIGNSFTATHDLPGIISALAEANDVSIKPQKALINGQGIAGHAENKKTLEQLSSKSWDGVILQGHSLEPILKKDEMIAGAKKLATKTGKTRIYVFVTWAYGSEQRFLRKSGALKKGENKAKYQEMFKNMQQLLNKGYSDLAKAVNGEIVPVGSVWEAARKKYPDWKLFGKDMYHPSPTGSYLTALVFYRTFFGKLPRKTVEKLIDQAKHDKMTALIASIRDKAPIGASSLEKKE